MADTQIDVQRNQSKTPTRQQEQRPAQVDPFRMIVCSSNSGAALAYRLFVGCRNRKADLILRLQRLTLLKREGLPFGGRASRPVRERHQSHRVGRPPNHYRRKARRERKKRRIITIRNDDSARSTAPSNCRSTSTAIRSKRTSRRDSQSDPAQDLRGGAKPEEDRNQSAVSAAHDC